jgi:Brp/Blh family beta-carotene 15,15'-monooxygenase
MERIRKISIIASFFSLWLNSLMNSKGEIIVSFFLIFSFGIIHGANDITLINSSSGRLGTQKMTKTLFNYLIAVGLGIVLFFVIPSFALLLFVLVSSYHFGEQHFNYIEKKKSKGAVLFMFCYGLTILSLLFYNHTEEVAAIIENITHFSIDELYFSTLLPVSLSMLLTSGIYIFKQDTEFQKSAFQEIVNLSVLALLFKVSPLLFGFSIYFVFWHSIPSMHDQIEFLHGETTLKTIGLYLKQAVLFWIISLVGIAILGFLLMDTYLFEALLFSFIAAITFPHVWVMIQLFKTKKANH